MSTNLALRIQPTGSELPSSCVAMMLGQMWGSVFAGCSVRSARRPRHSHLPMRSVRPRDIRCRNPRHGASSRPEARVARSRAVASNAWSRPLRRRAGGYDRTVGGRQLRRSCQPRSHPRRLRVVLPGARTGPANLRLVVAARLDESKPHCRVERQYRKRERKHEKAGGNERGAGHLEAAPCCPMIQRDCAGGKREHHHRKRVVRLPTEHEVGSDGTDDVQPSGRTTRSRISERTPATATGNATAVSRIRLMTNWGRVSSLALGGGFRNQCTLAHPWPASHTRFGTTSAIAIATASGNPHERSMSRRHTKNVAISMTAPRRSCISSPDRRRRQRRASTTIRAPARAAPQATKRASL